MGFVKTTRPFNLDGMCVRAWDTAHAGGRPPNVEEARSYYDVKRPLKCVKGRSKPANPD